MPSLEDYREEYAPSVVGSLLWSTDNQIARSTVGSAQRFFENVLGLDVFEALSGDNEALRQLGTVLMTYYLNAAIDEARAEAAENDFGLGMQQMGADRLVRALVVSTQRPDILGPEANADLVGLAKDLVPERV